MIYIITDHTFPFGYAATRRIRCLARLFQSTGETCKVIVVSRSDNPSLIPDKLTDAYDGIEYHHVGKIKKRLPGVLGRIQSLCHETTLIFWLNGHICKNDIVYGYIDRSARFLSKLISTVQHKGGKYVAELCEYPFVYEDNKEVAELKRVEYEEKIFPLCDGIIAISDNLLKYVSNKVKKGCEVINIPILLDPDNDFIEDKSNEASYPYIFHSGTHTEQKDGFIGMLTAFGKALPSLPSNIKFVSTGRVDSKEIEDVILRLNMNEHVIFTGYLEEKELKDYLSGASVVIINKLQSIQNEYCFPTKMGEYLAAGKYLIITDYGEPARWLRNGLNAAVVPVGNTEALAKAIIDAFNSEENRKKISEEGKRLAAKDFSYTSYGDKITSFTKSVKSE